MKLRTALALLMSVASVSKAQNIVNFSGLTRQFAVENNVYDGGPINGKTYTDIAKIRFEAATANTSISPNLKVFGYGLTPGIFYKGLPWGSGMFATSNTAPSTWTAQPTIAYDGTVYSPGNDILFWVDLTTSAGKAMYANILMAMETRALISVVVDLSSYAVGIGYKIVLFRSEQ